MRFVMRTGYAIDRNAWYTHFWTWDWSTRSEVHFFRTFFNCYIVTVLMEALALEVFWMNTSAEHYIEKRLFSFENSYFSTERKENEKISIFCWNLPLNHIFENFSIFVHQMQSIINDVKTMFVRKTGNPPNQSEFSTKSLNVA